IANEALINRNTFYLHYLDKPDLMEQLTKESMDRLNVCIISNNLKNISNKDIFKTILVETFKVIQSDIVFYQSMLSQNGQQNFSTLLKETMKNFMISNLEKRYKPHMEVRIEYMCSGLSGVICLWINDSSNLAVEDIINQVSELNYRIVSDML
ncbi:MAG: TetR-like C-terminal domain-containing protein, partial [Clostridium sp.]